MRSAFAGRSLAVALVLLAMLAVPSRGNAGGRSLPPDVDLDPDRGMSFGRLPKTSFDRRVFDSMKQSLGSRVMDPAVDPFNPAVRPSRYDPATGKIRDSLTDKMREIRRHEEASRKLQEAARRNAESSAARSAAALSRPSQPRRSGTTRPFQQKQSDD